MPGQKTKQCTACTNTLELHWFYRDKSRADGLMGRCIDCTRLKRKSVIRQPRQKMSLDERFESRKVATKKYEKTINGFIMRAYRNMKSRVLGIQKPKAHLYKGLFILPKEEFYQWSKSDASFLSLFQTWVQLGYPRTLTPSVDRIDSNKGYQLDNIRWITHGENSALGSLSKNR